MTWLTAFLDFPAESFDRGVGFWKAATGAALSATRGERLEFATLVPGDGTPYLRVQRLVSGSARIHLDVHDADPGEVRRRAVELGASLVDDRAVPTYRSAGGLVFCVVGGTEARRSTPSRWGAHRSVVDQVCIDIPPAEFDRECGFWAGLLERELKGGARPEFRFLDRSDDQQLRVLLQRLDDDDGPVRAHLDLASDNRKAEVARLVGLGARPIRRTDRWTTLRDPVGMEFCVTDRNPETGSVEDR